MRQVWSTQHVLHFACQRQGLREGPAGQDPRMDRQHPVGPQGQMLLPQPVDQGCAVGRLHQVVERVQPLGAAEAPQHGQGMQIVVAQQALNTALQRHQAAQHACRVWASIDQVAQNDQMVAAWRKPHLVQQTCQGRVAALYVTEPVNRHRLPSFALRTKIESKYSIF